MIRRENGCIFDRLYNITMLTETMQAMRFIKTMMCVAAMTVAAVWCRAAAEQTVTVDGTTIDNTITQLTFSGDEATLTFADGTTATVDMSLLTITFAYDDTSTGIEAAGVSATSRPGTSSGIVYMLDGRRAGTTLKGLKSGTYIVDGKKIIIR